MVGKAGAVEGDFLDTDRAGLLGDAAADQRGRRGVATLASAAELPVATLRQMAAYAAALAAIYPGREVRAGVLYTHAPVLFELEPAVLATHKQALQSAQQSLSLPDIE